MVQLKAFLVDAGFSLYMWEIVMIKIGWLIANLHLKIPKLDHDTQSRNDVDYNSFLNYGFLIFVDLT